MIAVVTFDVWETMIHDDPAEGERRGELRIAGMTRALRQAGCAVDGRRVRDAYHESWRQCEQIWSAGREVDPAEQLTMLLGDIDPELSAKLDAAARAAVDDAYVAPIFARPPALNEGLVDVLRALHGGGSRLGLICNTGRTPGYAMRRLLGSYGVLGFFQAVAFSNEEGVRKPNPEIFQRVLRRLGAAPAEAVHVGDDLVADIAGAKRSGMRAVLVRASYPSELPVAPDAHIRNLGELLPALERLEEERTKQGWTG